MNKYSFYCFQALFLIGALVACEPFPRHPEHLPKVSASVETDPVEAINGEDAADDPAIWLHADNLAESKIIGSNKKKGIEVYNLQGKRLFSYPVGLVNNIDIRYDFPLNDSMQIDIVAGSERSENKILVMGIHPDGSLKAYGTGITSTLPEVYGFCLYHCRADSQYYAFLNDKSGKIEKWKLYAEANVIKGILVDTFAVKTQPEGMVADDEHASLYVGEEEAGIWKFNADRPREDIPEFLSMSGKRNENIVFDIEGLAIYSKGEEQILLASSQGNHSYALFDMKDNYRYLGSFCIGDGDIDGSEETDGIEVASANFGGPFDEGILVVQDGYNMAEDGSRRPQNFKIVSWKEIVKNLPIIN